MSNKIDLEKYSSKKRNDDEEINLKLTAKKLLKLLSSKTGVNLRYGTLVFTYHNGQCFRVEAHTSHRLMSDKIEVPVVQMKLMGKK